jgi:hypothetical protein
VINVPTPDCENQTQGEYLSICIPEVTDEGYEHDEAVARCIGMWNNA